METNPTSLTPTSSIAKSVILRSVSVDGNHGFSDVPDSSEESDASKASGVQTSAHEPPKSPIADSKSLDSRPFVPSLGAWSKPPAIIPDVVSNEAPPSMAALLKMDKGKISTGKPPPEVKADGTLRFPWAAKMDPSIRNLYRTTSPSYMEDGTPKVHIPNHVLMKGLENQKEYIIGQFYRCYTPSGGLIHAVTNRLWGRKCKVFTRKLGESSYLFHIPDKATRDWVLQRGLWHIDDCIMFVAPWTSAATLALPEITTVPVWVTLKNIPSRLYSIEAISWIASGLGEPMVTNKPWLDPTQIGEAKLMVEVELEKGFPERIAAEDKRGNVSLVDVEYSWLPTKCKKCGQLGHKESRCLLRAIQSSTHSILDHVSVSVAPPASTKASDFVDMPAIVDVTTDAYVGDVAKSVDGATNITCPEAVKFNGNTANGVRSTATKEAILDCESLVASPVLDLPTAAAHVASPIALETIESTYPDSRCVDVALFDEMSLTTCLATPSVEVTTTKNIPTTSDLSNVAPFNTELALTFGVSSAQKTCSSPSHPTTKSALTFGSNQFAALDERTYAGFEMGDSSSQKTRGGRTIKPTQKMQDMNWIVVGGRGKRGRGGRGGRGSPC